MRMGGKIGRGPYGSFYKFTRSGNVAAAYMNLTTIYKVRRTRLQPEKWARIKAK